MVRFTDAIQQTIYFELYLNDFWFYLDFTFFFFVFSENAEKHFVNIFSFLCTRFATSEVKRLESVLIY